MAFFSLLNTEAAILQDDEKPNIKAKRRKKEIAAQYYMVATLCDVCSSVFVCFAICLEGEKTVRIPLPWPLLEKPLRQTVVWPVTFQKLTIDGEKRKQ